MNPNVLAALIGAAVTLAVCAVGFFTTWGSIRAAMESLTGRVCILETETTAIGDLRVEVAVLKSQLSGISELLKDLNASIRWLRDPAPFDTITRQRTTKP